MFNQAIASTFKSIRFCPSLAPSQAAAINTSHTEEAINDIKDRGERWKTGEMSVGVATWAGAEGGSERRAAPILLILTCGSLSRSWFLQVNRLETSRIQQWVMPKSKKSLLC